MRHWRMQWKAGLSGLAAATVLFGCASGGDGTGSTVTADPAAQADDGTAGEATLTVADLTQDGIVGGGPQGEPPASPEDLALSEEDAAKAREGQFKVGVIVQTMEIDWSHLQVRGITDTLEEYGAEVIGVVDPGFQVAEQIAGIENMIQREPDAIIAIPVDDTATAAAFKKISDAGIELILMDNIPQGLSHPDDYATMVSADSQGNGAIAAEVLASEIPEGGTIGIVGFGIDFFVTDERVVGFEDWVEENRPDLTVKRTDFIDPNEATEVTENFLTANADVEGLFVVWDQPAMGAVTGARTLGRDIPITTIDLGLEAAREIASGGLLRGLGAQRPYDQGAAEALAALNALIGNETPAWVGVQSLPVIQSNVLEAYETVWHEEAPAALQDACTGPCAE